ncbi:MAG: hypothetical protein EP326_06110 [Deltaproteobacteria bacterium]|jgi:hypothetical protein|nr:MAG: hypothetical protein EP326_06110 [Deltaproteobacteria bacterium]
MKFLLTIVLLSILSLSHAYEPEAAVGRIGFSGCHASYKQSLKVLHRDLAEKVFELNHVQEGIRKYSLNWVLNNYIRPDGRRSSTRFQYKTHAATYVKFHDLLVTGLGKMGTKVRGGYSYYCRTERDQRCAGGGGTIAYVLNLGPYTFNRIYLCPEFWKGDRNEQLSTLFHELSHLAADTDHYFGSIFNDEGMIQQTNDAYFYEKMMHNELSWVLERNSWAFLWMKPRENPPIPLSIPERGHWCRHPDHMGMTETL